MAGPTSASYRWWPGWLSCSRGWSSGTARSTRSYGVSLAAFCREQLTARAAQVGKTLDELAAWRPAPPPGRRARSRNDLMEPCEGGWHESRPAVSTLLRDVLDIPEQAGAEDYVLRLTDSIEPAADRPHRGRVRGDARAGGGVRRGARPGRRGDDHRGSAGARSWPGRSDPARATSWRSCTPCCGTTRGPGQGGAAAGHRPARRRAAGQERAAAGLPPDRRGVAGAGAVQRLHPADRARCTRAHRCPRCTSPTRILADAEAHAGSATGTSGSSPG